jgi:hypothetical protein
MPLATPQAQTLSSMEVIQLFRACGGHRWSKSYEAIFSAQNKPCVYQLLGVIKFLFRRMGIFLTVSDPIIQGNVSVAS